jgi:hypothetical protein
LTHLRHRPHHHTPVARRACLDAQGMSLPMLATTRDVAENDACQISSV